MNPVLGILALIGGVYLFYLGFSSFRFTGEDLKAAEVNPQSLKKGVMINFLNPSPYLFWTSIGGPLVLKSSDSSLVSAMVFIMPFYVLLVGSKVVVAVISGKSRNLLRSSHYRLIIRFLGLVLIGFGILFWRDGIRYLI
jgi:threonine/homoserine/homoserine lactone efflux protein